jgi:putative ABC transport system permease protein
MKKLRSYLLRIGGLFGRDQRERDLTDEMEANLAAHVEDNVARGMTPEEARRQALIRLGGMEQTKEAYRDQRSVPWMENLIQDVRYGARLIAKSPGFATIAVLSLALGIGANTTIFSIVNGVLWQPLPFAEPDRLVAVWEVDDHGGTDNATFATWQDWRAQSKSFDDIALIATWVPTANGDRDAEQLLGARVTNNFFRTLGVRPMIGRDFNAEEDTPKTNTVVMLTYGLWKRRYGSDPAIAGKTITLNQTNYVVAGVLPPDFRSLVYRSSNGENYEIYRVLGYEASLPWACRTCHHLMSVARLRDGVPLAQAQAEMSGIQKNLKKQYPNEYSGDGVLLQPLRDQIVAPAAPTLRLLLGAVGFVLLIACANLANLLLARSSYRRREIAVRVALGASRSRIVSQLLTENCLLALIAAAIGILPAYWAPALVRYFGGSAIPRLDEIHLNTIVVLFAVLVAVITGVISAIVPALRITGSQMKRPLVEGSRGASGAGLRTNSALIALEICLSLTLLLGAGLLLRSMMRVLNVNPGFDPQHVLSLRVALSGQAFAKDEPVRQYFAQVIERIGTIPGVESVGAASQVPMGGNMDFYGFHPQGKMNANPSLDPSAERYAITPGYLKTMRIPLKTGREFSPTDVATTPPVILVNQAAAKRIWPGEDPIGKQVKVGGTEKGWWTVVGVVGDVHHYGLDEQPTMQFYIPQAQWPNTDSDMTIVVRTPGDPRAIVSSVESVIRSIDANQPVSHVQPLDELVGASVNGRRLALFLIGGFATLALLLAAVGVYGVTSYSVAQRTREIGIRMALGATPAAVRRMVLRSGLGMTVVGAAFGLAGSFGVSRAIGSMLFGVKANDPATLGAVTAILLTVAAAACWIPARRATRVDPQIVLRQE